MADHKMDQLHPHTLQGASHFDNFYLNVLAEDRYNEPRPIKEEEYQPLFFQARKFKDLNHKDYETRIQQHYDDYETYKENKLGIYERQEAYTILEQMYSNGSPNKAVNEYFSKEKNIDFFERNKRF